jgi:transcriptional regulator with GAF, ATPase, and Fis domain
MRELFAMIETVAKERSTVLVTGESGTGKELVARAIHDLSERADRPFIPVNCGAVTETLLESELFGFMKGSFTGADQNRPGVFESADKGTIFLDEIGDMPQSMQVKMLRVLQDGKVRRIGASQELAVDSRVIAATNRDLMPMVDGGEIPEERCTENSNGRRGQPSFASSFPDDGIDLRHYLEAVERDLVSEALRRTAGNRTRAAELLKMEVHQFRYLLTKHNL